MNAAVLGGRRSRLPYLPMPRCALRERISVIARSAATKQSHDVTGAKPWAYLPVRAACQRLPRPASIRRGKPTWSDGACPGPTSTIRLSLVACRPAMRLTGSQPDPAPLSTTTSTVCRRLNLARSPSKPSSYAWLLPSQVPCDGASGGA
jgi:hypothetical protein